MLCAYHIVYDEKCVCGCVRPCVYLLSVWIVQWMKKPKKKGPRETRKVVLLVLFVGVVYKQKVDNTFIINMITKHLCSLAHWSPTSHTNWSHTTKTWARRRVSRGARCICRHTEVTLKIAHVLDVSTCVSIALPISELLEVRYCVCSPLFPTPSSRLPYTHSYLLNDWNNDVPGYQHTHILSLFLHFSVYIFILHMKNILLVIKNSISIFLYKYILNIKCMDYSYLLTCISLTSYCKICIRYTKEKQEQYNFILICFQFNSRGVDVSWLKSRSWENPFCDSAWLYFICCIWVGQDGRAEVADEGGTKNIWRQQTGNHQNAKVH